MGEMKRFDLTSVVPTVFEYSVIATNYQSLKFTGTTNPYCSNVYCLSSSAKLCTVSVMRQFILYIGW